MEWVTGVATLLAAIAAWYAAFTSRQAAQAAVDGVVLARKQITEQNLPRIVATFRRGEDSLYGSVLIMDISNYGGIATHLKLDGPNPTPPEDRKRHSIYIHARDLMAQSPAIKHGIDILRPGETIAVITGRYSKQELQDDFALELLDAAMSEDGSHRAPIGFVVAYSCDQTSGSLNLILDRTAEMRRPV